jgi:hypothetical protein
MFNLRGLDRWLPSYLLQTARRRTPWAGEKVHLLLCIADHYEPGNGGVSAEVARRRVADWSRDYPRMLGELRDSDGRPPRHSFFYPMEQYVESDLALLSDLCKAGFGEVEIHLHHDHDTSAALRQKLLEYKRILSEEHGLLAFDPQTRQTAYGFIHGDWALDNSLPDGSCCGVNDELDVLRQTGCYADFTLPAAPSPAQTRKINSIYYARDNPRKPKSHDNGVDVGGGFIPRDSLMLIQGPLVLNWQKRKFGLLPRIENSCIQANQAMAIERVDLWLRARVQVRSRPDWFFVKLHTHGAPEANARMLYGEAGVRFHRDLAERAKADPMFEYHYVTAREMYNLVRAAEAGWSGPVRDALNYHLKFNGDIRAAASPDDPNDVSSDSGFPPELTEPKSGIRTGPAAGIMSPVWPGPNGD